MDSELRERLQHITDLQSAMGVIALLVARLETLESEVIVLREENARLRKDSSTSSKPPSSDIVKPPHQRRRKGKRKSGGQPGHKGHLRTNLPAEKVEVKDLTIDCCPECGGKNLRASSEYSIKSQQVVELLAMPVSMIEYRRHGRFCSDCRTLQYPPHPANVIPNQILGPRLLSLLAYMKGGMSVSLSELRSFCEDVLGVPIAEGTISNAIFRASDAFKNPCDEVAEQLPKEEVLHIDETSWRDSGKKLWVWVFCSSVIAFFTIRPSRGCKVLEEVLGSVFSGAIVSDFYGAYVKYANELQQFCLAHLIRDIKFLTTLPDHDTARFGKLVLDQFKKIFTLWHDRHLYDSEQFAKKVKRRKKKLQVLLYRVQVPPGRAATMKKRLTKHWDSLFRFFERPDILQPTNNPAEQTLRHLVKVRRLTQGSRGVKGQLWAARACTVFATCRKQRRNTWDFIQQAVNSHFFGVPSPSLVQTT